jgi:hypothetical protein
MTKLAIKFLLPVILLIALSNLGGARIYYVDNSIPDKYSNYPNPYFNTYNPANFSTGGGSDYVYKTIADLNRSTFNPGDQILFRRGQIWREQLTIPSSGTGENVITFGAFGTGPSPIITGFDNISGFSPYGNIWGVWLTTQPNILTLNGTLGQQKNSIGDLKSNADWYWGSNSLYVYSSYNPSGLVEAGSRPYCIFDYGKSHIAINNIDVTGANYTWGGAIYIVPNGNYKSDDITISNVTAKFNKYHGIFGWNANQIVVDNSEVSYSGGGIYVYLDSSPSTTSSNIKITNSRFHDSSLGNGITFYSDNNSKHISNCTVYNNDIYNNCAGIYLIHIDNSIISYNNIHNNTNSALGASEVYGIGITSCNNLNIFKNAIFGNNYYGVFIYGDNTYKWGPSNYIDFYQNALWGNQGALAVGGHADYASNYVNVYSNIFTANSGGIVLDKNNSGNMFSHNTVYGGTGGLLLGGTNPGWTIQNNIFAQSSPFLIAAYNATWGVTLNNNCYYRDGGDLLIFYKTRYTAANIKAFEPTAVIANPLFTDLNTGNFQLQSNSPVRYAGMPLGSIPDYLGNYFSLTAPSIGAYSLP